VISTVTAGILFGRKLPLRGSARTRLDGQAHWELVVFVINSFVFLLIGLQLPTIIGNLADVPQRRLILEGLIIAAAVIAVRFAWIFPATYVPRMLFPSIRQRDPAPSWKAVTILAWAGMRGIVSLAAALALPQVMPSGAEFPYRDRLVFYTYVVILVTLVLPALTLPALLRWFGLEAGGEAQREELQARLASVKAVLNRLAAIEKEGTYLPPQVEAVRKRYESLLKKFEANLDPKAFSPLVDEDQRLRRLLREVIGAERQALSELRQKDSVHDDVFHGLQAELDVEELRLQMGRF
jgi:CPA1 family monovalent cation:H+ antiporter